MKTKISIEEVMTDEQCDALLSHLTQGGLHAVKFIRDEKKCDIRTAKEYMDAL